MDPWPNMTAVLIKRKSCEEMEKGEEDHVTFETEIGVKQTEAKELMELPEAEKGKEGSSP